MDPSGRPVMLAADPSPVFICSDIWFMHAVRWSIFALNLVSSPSNFVSILSNLVSIPSNFASSVVVSPSRQLFKHCTLVVRASTVQVMSVPGVDVARVLAAEVTSAEVVPLGRLMLLDWVPHGIKELVVSASPCIRLSSGL